MTKSQVPKPKFQGKPKLRALRDPSRAYWSFGTWGFFGICSLGFGISTWACLLCALGLGLWPQRSAAQTNAAALGTNSNRYLLLVETSRAMQRRSAGMIAAVKDLLDTSMSGQLRRGDTLGIWTYNQQLYAGRFPLQQWSPESQRTLTTRVLAFLQEQTYENQAALPLVMPALERLIKQSPFLTIILISDGEQKIHGTPFDAAINKSFDTWEQEQQKARMPLLTVLRAQAGRLNAYSVNAAPWPVDMPPLPKELLEAKAQKKEAASPAPAPKPLPPVGPSLYLSGKKSQPAGSSNSPALLTTNAPAVATPTNSSAPRLESSSAPIPAPAASLLKSGSDVSAPAARDAQESKTTPGTRPAPMPAAAEGDRLISSLTNAGAAVVAGAPAASAVPSPKPEQAEIVSAKASPDSNPPTIINPPSSLLAAPASGSQSAVAGPEPPISSVQYPVTGFRIWMIAGSALAVAALLVFVWVRRSRSSRRQHVSLITHSFDREKS